MANHVSSLKRARQTVAKTAVNRANKTRVRGSLRLLREAIAKGDHKAAAEQYRAALQLDAGRKEARTRLQHLEKKSH